jgi:hypothetical protein
VARAAGYVRDLGLDAVSAYAVAGSRVKQGTYGQLATIVERFWNQTKAAGLPLVPIAMTGWDRRPRVMNPVPWEAGASAPQSLEYYFERPSGTELSEHMRAALVAAQEDGSSARTVLVYAWNEFDEGGWLAPTLGDKGGRLRAVKTAVDSACAARPR